MNGGEDNYGEGDYGDGDYKDYGDSGDGYEDGGEGETSRSSEAEQ